MQRHRQHDLGRISAQLMGQASRERPRHHREPVDAPPVLAGPDRVAQVVLGHLDDVPDTDLSRKIAALRTWAHGDA